MKKVLVLWVVLMFLLTGCGSNDENTDNNDTPVPAESFVGYEWYRATESCGETICLDLDESFYYYEDCGNPLEDSDLYNSYSYNADKGILTVTSAYGEDDMTIKVVSCEDNKLVLDFDGEEKIFERSGERAEEEEIGSEEDMDQAYVTADIRIGEAIAIAQEIINNSRTSYSSEKYDFEGYGNAYSQCNEAVKKLYDEMIEKIDRLEYFSYSIEDGYTYEDLDNVYAAWAAISVDAPYYDTYFTITDVLDEAGEMTKALESRYFAPYDSSEEIEITTQEIKEELDIFNAECQLIIDGMDETWSTYDKYRYLAVVISLQTSYDYEFTAGIESGSGYSAIDGGLSICEGYATAMQMLCARANLYCQLVSGQAGEDSHAWNLVKLDSGTYYIDVTWSDEQDEPGSEAWCEYFMFTEEKAQESRVNWDHVSATGTEIF